MPVSRDEWEKGITQDTTKARIENLLRNNQDKAYTMDEIREYLVGKPKDMFESVLHFLYAALVVRPGLEELIKEGSIEAREVKTEFGKVVYYAWK